jgi:hypothetical protein
VVARQQKTEFFPVAQLYKNTPCCVLNQGAQFQEQKLLGMPHQTEIMSVLHN